MHEKCSHCELVYEKEVGFFYGAMYVSYGLTSGFFITSYVIDQLWVHSDVWSFILFILIVYIILFPFTYRQARLIWLNFFHKYDEAFD
jgi:hypothetical protein